MQPEIAPAKDPTDVSSIHTECLHTLENQNAELRKYVEWVANVAHQAYHLDASKPLSGWRECNGAICREARRALEATRQPDERT